MESEAKARSRAAFDAHFRLQQARRDARKRKAAAHARAMRADPVYGEAIREQDRRRHTPNA